MTPRRSEAIPVNSGRLDQHFRFGILDADTDLGESLEMDSLDFLTFVETLSDRSARRIDEDDYPRLATIETGVTFLTEVD